MNLILLDIWHAETSNTSGLIAFLLAIYFMFIGFMIISLIFRTIGMWKVFEKAGKPGWAAIIPVYNIIIMTEITGKPTIWVLWCFIPCANVIFIIWLHNLMSKSFGKSEGFTVGLVMLGFIFWPILGFGNAKYLGPSAEEAQRNNGKFEPFNPNDPFNQPPVS